jgi:hypothetical protein
MNTKQKSDRECTRMDAKAVRLNSLCLHQQAEVGPGETLKSYRPEPIGATPRF